MPAVLLLPAQPAQAVGPSGVTISQVAPAYGNVGLYIERVAPTTANASPTWRVNVDMLVTAPDDHGVTLKSITTSYPGSALSSYSYGMVRGISAGDTLFLIVPESRRFTFPLAPSIRFTLYFEGYDPIVVNRTLTEYKNKTPSGGYRFPANAVSDGYWANFIGHENGAGHDTHHRGVQNQRFAYDLAVAKWDPFLEEWSGVKAGTNGSSNDEHWTFGTPIYAMADGYIRKCRRDQVDNIPGAPDPTPEVEGNHLYIEHATGEVALYAHFKSGSPSTSLCPASAADNLNIFVKQGQFLGYSGNTGNSYGPHLHLHLATKKGFGTSEAPAQGIPLRFNHATTRTYTNNYGPGGAPGFFSLTNSTEGALSDWSLIQPNGCGWNRVAPGGSEFARHGVKLGCYQEEFEDIVLAGYRQVWRQQVDYNSQAYVSSIWRPKAGLSWTGRHNLTGSDYQSLFNTYTGAGYRLTHVDSYLQNGAVRYSAVFTNTSGPAWRAYHGVSSSTHQSNFNTWTSQGYRPINVSVVVVDGTRYYTALYEAVSIGSYTHTTVAESSYQTYFNSETAAGRKLTYIDVFQSGSVNRFSVVFASGVGSNWSSIHNATSTGYRTAYNTNTSAGRLTRAVSAYVSNGLKYAGLWRQ